MKTCLKNCRPGDKIHWNGKSVEIFTVTQTFDNMVIGVERARGKEVVFHPRTLSPNTFGHSIIKIVKKKVI